jgi:hypothetical protein
MNERRKKARKDWAIKNDRGAVLEWKVDRRHTKADDSDPLERTYNLLQKLTVPGLDLEENTPMRRYGRDPYDNAKAFKSKKPVARK